MIEVWSWPTPNGHKVHIALEELGLPYTIVPVDIGAGDQFKSEFLAITPNHRIPAIVDPDGPGGKELRLFESGAILIYLAEKTGRLIPADPAARYVCLQWLMFQMGGVGPMFGQWNHFASYAPEKLPYAIERYTNEVARLYRVLDKRLGAGRVSRGRRSIRSPTSRPGRGRATRTGAASISTACRIWRAGSMRWRRGRRCSAASRCCPTTSGAARWMRRSARCCSARPSSRRASTRNSAESGNMVYIIASRRLAAWRSRRATSCRGPGLLVASLLAMTPHRRERDPRAHAGGYRRRRAGGPAAGAPAAPRGHRIRHSRSPLPRLCRGPHPRRRARTRRGRRCWTQAGVGERLQREGLPHHGTQLLFGGTLHRIDFLALTGKHVTVYGQHDVVQDLIAARFAAGGANRVRGRAT